MRADHPSAPLPPDPIPPHEVEAAGEPTDDRPSRAARRGKHAGIVRAAHGRGGALSRIPRNPQDAQARDPGSSAPSHAQGAQGRRVNPVRRTG